jgi:hypothetical protein
MAVALEVEGVRYAPVAVRSTRIVAFAVTVVLEFTSVVADG